LSRNLGGGSDSTHQGVDDGASVQQLGERGDGGYMGRGRDAGRLVQIGPGGRDHRACAVREHDDEMELTVTMGVAEDIEALAFERMPTPDECDLRRVLAREVVVGSLSSGLSMPSPTNGW
jgi:hypothetical protein